MTNLFDIAACLLKKLESEILKGKIKKIANLFNLLKIICKKFSKYILYNFKRVAYLFDLLTSLGIKYNRHL